MQGCARELDNPVFSHAQEHANALGQWLAFSSPDLNHFQLSAMTNKAIFPYQEKVMKAALAKRIVTIIPKSKTRSTEHSIDLKAFIDSEVIAIVKNSTTYKHVRASQDHNDFRDMKIKQWDTVTGAILCYLKFTASADICLTQSVLFIIAKEAAKLALGADGKLKNKSYRPKISPIKRSETDVEIQALLEKALHVCSMHTSIRNHSEDFYQPLTVVDAAALKEIGWTGKLSSNRQSIPKPNSKLKTGPTFVAENFENLTEHRKASIQFWSGLCSILAQNNGRIWIPEIAAVAIQLGICIPTPSQLASRLTAMTGLAVSRPTSAAGWLYCKINQQPIGVELWSQLWMNHLAAFRKSVVNKGVFNNFCSSNIHKAVSIKAGNLIMDIQQDQEDRSKAA